MTDYSVTGAVAGVPLGIKPQIIEVVLTVRVSFISDSAFSLRDRIPFGKLLFNS